MESNNPASLKGQLIIAMPDLADPNFAKTVSCICEHTPQGAVGIVLNRVHPTLSGKNVFEELKIEYTIEAASIPIHIGGPVHMGEIFVLHGPPFGWEGSLMVTSSLALSNTIDILQAIAADNGPRSYIIAIGCAGWGSEQLDSEIKANSWLTCPLFERVVFDIPIEARWKEAVNKMGIDPALLSNAAGHA